MGIHLVIHKDTAVIVMDIIHVISLAISLVISLVIKHNLSPIHLVIMNMYQLKEVKLNMVLLIY